MSTLTVTSVTTGNATTDFTLSTGNTTSGDMVIFSNGYGILVSGNSSTNTAIFSPNGHVVIANTSANTVTLTSTGNMTIGGTAVMGSSFIRNRIINGNMYIAQRATSATVTAGTTVPTASTGYPCIDRWFVYSTGANVTAAQVAGVGANNKSVMRITGAASVTAVGIGQRIESLNSWDLATQTCTLSADISNSLLTTVTWAAYYATTSADTFGTIGTPTKTLIATGTFTVTSTLTRYTTNIAIPGAATTGIEILFTVGAQTSGTWEIGNVQLEAGSIATPYERRQYQQELALCQRCYFDSNPGSSTASTAVGAYAPNGLYTFSSICYPVTMRAVPTISFRNQAYIGATSIAAGSTYNISFTPAVQTTALAQFLVNFNYTAAAEIP